jgi:predicted RNA-binding Zn-ribbon protein involved in translation (DUF1610 family)
MEQNEELDESLTIKCNACAAEFTTEVNITSQECPFCGINIVATGRSTKHIKPRALWPFVVKEHDALISFRQWISKLWFATSNLIQRAQRDLKVNGVYVPYWTYDSDTTSFYSGKRGEYYWEIQIYHDKKGGMQTRQVRRTRWYPAQGTVWHSFNDVLILASHSLPR